MGIIKANIRLAESAARTATETFEVDSNNLSNGVFVVDITAGATGTDTVTIGIEGYDNASKDWYTLLTSAALNSNAKTLLRVGEYTTAASNLAAEDFLPKRFRVIATKNNATSITYSIGANLSG